jgi:cobalt-zinc-cadmium efflux system membrane fusion protein
MNRIMTIALLVTLSACSSEEAHQSADGHAATTEFVRGPHGGRLLTNGEFSLEVVIFEDGVPPQFRLYARQGERPLPPTDVQASITLTRFGGQVDVHRFEPGEDHLHSAMEVHEPHSFDVQVQARHAGRDYQWRYESYEGRTRIATVAATDAGVGTVIAGGGILREQLHLYGVIAAHPERLRRVTARFPGLVRNVRVQAGDRVRAGDPLANVESNESLQVYAVSAPITGVITSRMANPGETAGDQPLFEIADYSVMRAELTVFPRDFARLRPGQPVRVRATDGDLAATARIDSLATQRGMTEQSLLARVSLPNADGRWTPGLFITASVAVAETPVSLAVPRAALQTFRDWDVVYLNDGDVYQAQPVRLGRSDDDTVEILDGIRPGQRIVIANSYLIKADIEKAGASHDH